MTSCSTLRSSRCLLCSALVTSAFELLFELKSYGNRPFNSLFEVLTSAE